MSALKEALDLSFEVSAMSAEETSEDHRVKMISEGGGMDLHDAQPEQPNCRSSGCPKFFPHARRRDEHVLVGRPLFCDLSQKLLQNLPVDRLNRLPGAPILHPTNPW